MKKFVGIDFDGTIVDDAFPEIGRVKAHSLRVMKRLIDAGHTVVIWTCRDYGVIKPFVDEHFSNEYAQHIYINENPRGLRDKWKNDPRKVGVDLFIDDKNLFTRFVDWEIIEEELEFIGYLSKR